MIRLFLLDLAPFLLFVGLVTGTWVYDRDGFLPSGLIYAILFLLYEKLNRIEFSLSEDMREALLLRSDHRVLYGLGKLALAGLVGAGVFYNHERSWVDVEAALARAGLSAGQTAGPPVETERAGAAWREGMASNGSAGQEKPVEGAKIQEDAEVGGEPGTPERAPERPETKIERREPRPDGGQPIRTEEVTPQKPEQKKPEAPVRIEEPKSPAGGTETATLEPRAEPKTPARADLPPVSNFQFEED